MRIFAAIALGALAACSSNVRVPSDTVIYEVPQTGIASTSGGTDSFTSTIEGALAEGGPVPGQPLPPDGTPLDDDNLNLTLYTIEQQKIDAAIAERELAEARANLVVVPPSATVPNATSGVNIALFAQQTSNQVGENIYGRRGGTRLGSACGRYPNPDDAQRAFLAAGGPTTDSLGLDPNGDGFACKWDPAPFRQLRM
jgi:hypothetical protein